MYCKKCGAEIKDGDNFCPVCGSKIKEDENTINKNSKSKIAAGLFAILLGPLGIHNFYLGYTLKALLQLFLPITTLIVMITGCVYAYSIDNVYLALTLIAIYIIVLLFVWVWAFIEGILIFTGRIKDKEGYDLV